MHPLQLINLINIDLFHLMLISIKFYIKEATKNIISKINLLQ